LRAAALPLHHRDPFDRMLIAQAQVEDMTLVSADLTFNQYEVSLLWAASS
jgi:PIN domain nuclease of toxin-antitoxin system